MTKVSTQTWLDLGFATLLKEGCDGLSAEKMAKNLGITRGSFYHRFGSREGYVTALLDAWAASCAQQIEQSQAFLSTPSTLRDSKPLSPLHEYAWHLPHQLDIAVRSWSQRDPLVQQYQSRVDKMRLSHVLSIFKSLNISITKANRISQVAYISLVGAQHVVSNVKSLSFDQFKHALDATLQDALR